MTARDLAGVPLVSWQSQEARLPGDGSVLLASYDAETIVVYQAFNPHIAEQAVAEQGFGDRFSLSRMSWIKPGFLWMMYRSGWATKEGQERVLAVRIQRSKFDDWVRSGVRSSYESDLYPTQEDWRDALQHSSVRIQWDPDHDPHGHPLNRRAIQIGLRSTALRDYASTPVEIVDITDFVHAQHRHVRAGQIDQLLVPLVDSYSGS